MSFRQRVTIATATAVAVAIVLASALVYVAARGEQLRQVDSGLTARASSLQALGLPRDPSIYDILPEPPFGGAGVAQYVSADGEVITAPQEDDVLPVSARTRRVAAGSGDAFFETTYVNGTHVRVLTVPVGPGFALQVARPLDELDRVLARLRAVLLLIAIGGIALAASLATIVARTALRPVDRLTQAAERIARTGDPSEHIDVDQTDEIGRLAASFNTMLSALDDSLRSQRELVADASHELRTPLTSLRTNIEVLARSQTMAPQERERLLADVVAQLDHLSRLVQDLVELARGSEHAVEPEEVRLDEVVARAVEHAQRSYRGARYALRADPCLVRGVPEQLERAISNLLDNAGKWSPPGGEVDVGLTREGVLEVRDRGPGIADDDLPRIFDRFYRAPGARSLSGSGLGLAIVRHIATAHRGEVEASNAAEGGAVFRLSLPATPVAEEARSG